jgi:hypothetical protein
MLRSKAGVHGRWLPWLKAQGSFSERSAQRFMATARYASKFKSATVADLLARLNISEI